jgi:hypothetical protein
MTNFDKQEPAGLNVQKLYSKTPLWKRLLKFALSAVFVVVLLLAAFVGAFVFKYQRVVRARPGDLQRNKGRPRRGLRCPWMLLRGAARCQ